MESPSPSPSPTPEGFSGAYDQLGDLFSGFGDMASAFPEPFGTVIVAALAVVAGWFIIKLAIQIIGMFLG